MKKLLIVALLGFLTACTSNDSETKGTPTEENAPMALMTTPSPTGSSTFLSKDTANVMIESYLNSNLGDSTALASLIIDADSLRAYLSDTSIKNVKLMFAHTMNYIKTGGMNKKCGYRSGALTIVLSGYDAQGNYKYYNGNQVMDNANPCPSLCPVSGTAQYNYFPQ